MGTRTRRLALAVAIGATAVWGVPGASAEPPEGVQFASDLSPEAREFAWTGTLGAGVNVSHTDPALGESCGTTPESMCDRVLLTVTLPVPEGARSQSGAVTVDVGDFTVPVADYDVFTYDSDEAGTRGAQTGTSGNLVGEAESVTVSLTSTPADQVHHVLVEIPYFVAVGAYEGAATLVPGRTRS